MSTYLGRVRSGRDRRPSSGRLSIPASPAAADDERLAGIVRDAPEDPYDHHLLRGPSADPHDWSSREVPCAGIVTPLSLREMPPI